MTNYLQYIKVIGAPKEGNWIRYIPWLSTEQVVVGVSFFHTSLSPSRGLLTIPITIRSRTRFTQKIEAGAKTSSGARSVAMIKKIPYRWEFDIATSGLLTEQELLETFGRSFCELIFTDRFDTLIEARLIPGLKENISNGVNQNIEWQHLTFLHDVLDPAAHQDFKTSALQYRLVHESA